MIVTIEHNAHVVWDVNEIFPGNTIVDAFECAGGIISERNNGIIVVVRLAFEEVRKICDDIGADYIGPVIRTKEPSTDIKDVTPKGP